MFRHMLSRILFALITAIILFYFLFSGSNRTNLRRLADYSSGKHTWSQVDHDALRPAWMSLPETRRKGNPDVASSHGTSGSKNPSSSSQLLPKLAPSIAIVSMLYGAPSDYYVRAIESYERYAERYNYPMYVMRRRVTEGVIDGVWNKCAYILHVLVTEMQKAPEERAQWLLWADADSVLTNPSIPLDIFLPPDDFENIHLIASKDESGFNMGIFFLRVHPWSITYMTKVLAFPIYKPDVDLFWKEQSASTIIFEEREMREHVLYQPRMWWNPYRRREAFEGDVGSVIIHFPNLSGWREQFMLEYLKYVESPDPSPWEIPLKDSKYPQEIEQFWATVRYGKDTIEQMHQKISDWPKTSSTFKLSFQRLDEAMKESTGDVRKVKKAADDVLRAYELYESRPKASTDKSKSSLT